MEFIQHTENGVKGELIESAVTGTNHTNAKAVTLNR